MTHDLAVRLDPAGGEIALRIQATGPAAAPLLVQIDTDGDGVVSASEQRRWTIAVRARLRVTVDDQPIALTLAGVGGPGPGPPDSSRVLTMTLQFAYRLSPAAAHRFRLADTLNYLGNDVYRLTYVDAAQSAITDQASPGPGVFSAQFVVEGFTSGPGAVAPAAPPPQSGASTPGAGLLIDQASAFLATPAGSLRFGVLVFLLAVGVGGLHALQPGHGKTMVAAYLVGSQGRVRDAVLLGGVVTLTHTSSVVLLGLALLLINNLALPRAFQPALELLSGLLIVGVGGALLWQRVRDLRVPRREAAGRIPRAPRVADHGPAVGGTVEPREPAPDDTPGGPHPQEHGLPDHTHGDGHGHADGHGHIHVLPARASVRDLVGLGISGGLIPCPEALTVMLLAAGVGQVGLGIALVSSFSVGLAAVLIAIGVLMVKARRLLERLLPGKTGPKWARWLPVVSAGVVMVLGSLVMLGALGQPWR